MREGIDCKGRKWVERELTPQMADITNLRVGDLVALFPVYEPNKKTQVLWLCRCICGNEIVRAKHSLSNKTTLSCGCSRYQKLQATVDKRRQKLIGQKFNKLTVLKVAEERSNKEDRAYYECECECGKHVILRGTDLVLGKQLSCGCAKKDAEARKRTDLTGQQFGRLTVRGFSHIENQASYWRCRCSCGNELVVKGSYMTSGHIHSCGCLLSVGEDNITKVLQENNIVFKQQFMFTDLVSDKQCGLRYDFALLDETSKPIRLIEFDGPQHEQKSTLFDDEASFQRRQAHDNLKNQYAFDRNIPLVRIPYKERDNITLDLLLGDRYLLYSPS